MGAHPPSGPGENQVVRILSAPESAQIVVTFLGPIDGMDTHWVGPRSFHCLGEESGCPSSLHKKLTLWKGYAPVEVYSPIRELWIPYVFEITEALEERLRTHKLRGMTFLVFRQGVKGKQAEVFADPLERVDPANLSPSFDIQPPLKRLYHTDRLRLGVANPLAAKLVLPTVHRPGPSLPNIAEITEHGDSPEDLAAAKARLSAFARSIRGARAVPGAPDKSNANGQNKGKG